MMHSGEQPQHAITLYLSIKGFLIAAAATQACAPPKLEPMHILIGIS